MSYAGAGAPVAGECHYGGSSTSITLADSNTTLAGFQSDFEWIVGSDHADTLTGSAGDDTLEGSEGADSLTGGAGSDVFYFAGGHGADTIADFANGEDRIDLENFVISAAQWNAILGSATAITGGVRLDLSGLAGGGTIDVMGIAPSALDATDFSGVSTGPPPPPPPLPPPPDPEEGERVTGTSGEDTLAGTGKNDTLSGGGGDDRLDGGSRQGPDLGR